MGRLTAFIKERLNICYQNMANFFIFTVEKSEKNPMS